MKVKMLTTCTLNGLQMTEGTCYDVQADFPFMHHAVPVEDAGMLAVSKQLIKVAEPEPSKPKASKVK